MNGSTTQVSLDLGTLVRRLYHQMPMTPENSLAVRAIALALVANVSISDYLNSWNEASGSREKAKELLAASKDAAEKALALDSRLALAHYARALVHRTKKQRKEALDHFGHAIEHDSGFARAYAQRGNALINDGKFDDALKDIDNAIEIGSTDASAGIFYWNRGRVYFFKKEYKAAITPLTEAVQRRPNLWYTWLYLVSAYAHTEGEPFTTAKEWLRKFETDSPFKDVRFTIEKVASYEDANPTDNQAVKDGRDEFHQGLRWAEMKEQ